MNEPTPEDVKQDIIKLYSRISRLEDIVQRLNSENEEIRRINHILDGIDTEEAPLDIEFITRPR